MYTEESFFVGAQETFPQGLGHDGTHFLAIGSGTDTVYKYLIPSTGPVGDFAHRDLWVREALQKDGNTNDLWIEYWTSAGVSPNNFTDMASDWLASLGFTGDNANKWFFWEEANLRGL